MMNTRSRRLHIKTFLLCLPVILALSCSQALAQWAITFGGEGEETQARVIQTSDGGYLSTSSTGSFAGPGELLLIKFSANGNVEWKKIYRISIQDYRDVWIYSVKQSSDNGFILAGQIGRDDDESYAYILKLDQSGNIQWRHMLKILPPPPQEDLVYHAFHSVQQTTDGGYIAAGYSAAYRRLALIAKFSASGGLEWVKTYGVEEPDPDVELILESQFYEIDQTGDGGFIAAGSTYNYASNNSDALVVKLDGNGDVQWLKLRDGMVSETSHPSDCAYSVEQTSDNGFVVAGDTMLLSAVPYDSFAWVIKLGSDGSTSWSKSYASGNWEFARVVRQTSDGGFAVAGSTSSLPSNNDPVGWLFKLDGSGVISWQKKYYAKSLATDNIYSLDISSNGYILSGETNSFGDSFDIWVLNVNPNGEIPDCEIVGEGAATAGSFTPLISLPSYTVYTIDSSSYTLTNGPELTPYDIALEINDVCSLKIDSDQDGIEDGVDNCPDKPNFEQKDMDHDGIGDVCDPDADDDTYYKIGEYYPSGQPGDDCNDFDPAVYPGLGCLDVPEDEKPSSSNSSVDADGDGVANTIDNCASIKNADQKDTDGDKIGDVCDLCPNDALNDADHDAVCGNVDNCPTHYNPLSTWIDINDVPHTGQQPDFDLDQQGDACDPDADNDGYAKTADCNDLDPSVNPGKVEIANNNKDDDCNVETPDKGILFTLTSNKLCEGDVACTLENWLPRDDEIITVTASIGGVYSGTVTSLLCSNASAYPGKYSNDKDTTATPDFDCTVKSASTVELASHDYGGKIQITATATVDGNPVVETLVLPRDTDLDGLPDYWEKWYGNLAANENLDKDPEGVNQFYGDGLTAFEEYRGFKWGRLGVSADSKYNTAAFVPIDTTAAVHFRTDPTRKDLFVKFIDYDSAHPFAVGAAFVNAEIDVHAIDAELVSLLSDPVWEGKHVVTVTHTSAFYPLTDGHINKRSVRNWEPDTKGWSGVGTETSYGADTKTYNPSFVGYFYDKPYLSGQTWDGSQWKAPNSVLDPYDKVEDVNDNAVLDSKEDWTPTNNALDGDKLVSPYVWASGFSALDIDDDGLVELPLTTVPYPSGSNYEYTLAQSLKHTITHEIGHAIGMTHSTDPNCVMYEVSTNWTRDGFFCNAARAQSQMH